MGFRANLNKKFKVALNPSSKVASYPANQNSKKKKEWEGVGSLRIISVGHTNTMVTYCGTTIITMC